jgi:hypothetical protein
LGTLEERFEVLGPGSRGGLAYTLVTEQSRLNVYAANARDVLEPFLGRPVLIRGKLVDLRNEGEGQELWIASIEVYYSRLWGFSDSFRREIPRNPYAARRIVMR